PIILTRAPGYVLLVDAGSIDARRFERLITHGVHELGAGDRSSGTADLRAALELWRGPPLSDFAYEEFAQPDIHRLQELRAEAIEELAEAEIDAGNTMGILPLLDAAIREDPLRERARELQMLALYRAGRQAEALRTFQRYRLMLAEELGLDPSPGLRRLQERILVHDPTLVPQRAAEPGVTRNPFKGLRAFEEGDREDFFGRDVLVHQLVERFAAGARLIAVVGPSGCGKSSVVNAGLIPAVRSGELPGGWRIERILPGRHPTGELQRVQEGSEPILLVLDQFEQLFTEADPAERDAFLDRLATLAANPRGPWRIVLTLRADFYDRPLLHPAFAGIFTAGVVNVMPMSSDELESAIAGPAERAGLEVQPALLAELVAQTLGRTGALPLLQYVLTELFDRRRDSALTLDAYRASGGLQGTLTHRAEELHASLNDQQRRIAKQVFLRLTRLGEGTRHARRRTRIGELTSLELDPVALSEVLERFGSYRLVSFDHDLLTGDATVEIAHEALLWEWDRLAGWIEEHRIDLRKHLALVAAIEEWQASGRQPDYLLSGSRLAEYQTWASRTTLRLTEEEGSFLDAGLERRLSLQAEEAARAQQQRHLERRARTRLIALVTAVIVLIGGATYALFGRLTDRPPDVVLVWEGMHGDGGWADMIGKGFDAGVARLRMDAERRIVPLTAPERFAPELRAAAGEGARLVVIGGTFEDAEGTAAVARDHPDTHFVSVDWVGPTVPNITYVRFREEEGSFLAGAAAALKSRTGRIGFIGGAGVWTIWRCEAGYEAGARWVDPEVRVRSVYLQSDTPEGGLADDDQAWRKATRMYQRGADVIFAAAGGSGFGVFKAAALTSEDVGRHLWAIGVDSDQYRTVVPALRDQVGEEIAARLQRHILTSMVKHLDTAVFTTMSRYANGALRPGVRRLGLAEGGVDIAYSGGFIDDVRPELEHLRRRIIAGEITVPVVPSSMGKIPGAGT
ncbi:MAG TPA: BTAD domain-containing putative transcriptional regulator, partial [Actinomycetota bacterium]|nr:BTAD domain-containing putative transcriptional regulator [Actinomycetota bacterium]